MICTVRVAIYIASSPKTRDAGSAGERGKSGGVKGTGQNEAATDGAAARTMLVGGGDRGKDVVGLCLTSSTPRQRQGQVPSGPSRRISFFVFKWRFEVWKGGTDPPFKFKV